MDAVTVEIVIISLLPAVTLVEALLYAIKSNKFRRPLSRIKETTFLFQKTESEDERQKLLIESGVLAILTSTSFLALCIFLTFLALLPIWLLRLDTPQTEVYIISTTVACVLAFVMRPRRGLKKPIKEA
jgi:hypothetical protein